MNDTSRRNGTWSTPAQQSCPNCRQNAAQNANLPGAQIPFLSREMQERIWPDPAGAPPAGMPTAGMPPMVTPPAGMPPTGTVQQPYPQATSNYEDLGMAPAPTAGVGSAQGSLLPVPMPRQNGQRPLQSLVGATPSPTELPGLTAVDIANRLTAYNAQSLQYLNGFLITQIGRSVTATFLIGSSSMDVRSGTLVGVGANYILINEFESNDIIACDFYSIKFIKIYY